MATSQAAQGPISGNPHMVLPVFFDSPQVVQTLQASAGGIQPHSGADMEAV